MKKPLFIVFEGLDGSGKTTQIKRLATRLNEEGKRDASCFVTHTPSKNPIGAMAREASKGAISFMNETLALLFAADFYQHFNEEIMPALNNGKYVLCDRYYFSNMAYQGTDDAVLERIITYNKAVMAARKPDVVFFLDITPEECMRRINSTRTETGVFETLERQKLQRERFLAAFERLKDTENIVTINAANKDAVSAEVWAYLQAQY
ncbi:MAG: dTMP kinase [Defluviitaleaceae bacterium]|nr:dTMP kinase [Defluviitaleaceae bacterium]